MIREDAPQTKTSKAAFLILPAIASMGSATDYTYAQLPCA